MTALTRLIARRIAASGPMTVAEYMATALGHPEHGYYMTRDPFGRAGDFITAPEVSQIFGELIGIWCAAVWQMMGRPSRFNLVELGPGRGTLMADALRAVVQAPEFIRAAKISLVETSPVLRAAQHRTLPDRDIVWYGSLDEVPEGPLLLIANEFFDALPVHQLVRTDRGWRERLVGETNGAFGFLLSAAPSPTAALLPPGVRDGAPVGAVAEVQPAALGIAGTLARRIAADGGAALIVDYGHSQSAPGETLQAVRGHEPVGVLDAPGEVDLTVHVDFAALARAAAVDAVAIWGPCTQGDFLRRMGIAVRAENLAAQATPAQSAEIAAGVERLIAGDQMGNLFKVLGLASDGMPTLPGFMD